MLLNEFRKEHGKAQALQATVEHQQKQIAAQQATAAKQQEQIQALTAGLQKVTARVDANQTTTHFANN